MTNEVKDSIDGLPRNTGRFKHLYPNERAVIREDAIPSLRAINSAELVAITYSSIMHNKNI